MSFRAVLAVAGARGYYAYEDVWVPIAGGHCGCEFDDSNVPEEEYDDPEANEPHDEPDTGDPEKVVAFWESLRKRLDKEACRCTREFEKAERGRDWIRKSDYDSLKHSYGPLMIRDSTNLVVADEMIKYAYFNYGRERFQSLAKRLGKALDYKPERDFDILELNFPQFKSKLEGMVYGLQVVTNGPAKKGQ